MPKYYPILDNGVSPMASKKSGYNKSGGKKNDPNRAKFVDKYVKQNTKSADRPATKKQARNAYYLTSVDDKKGARGAKQSPGKKTAAGSMMRTRADGNKPGARVRGMDNAGPSVRAGVGRKATYPPKSAGMAGASKEKRVAGKSTRNPSWSTNGKPQSLKGALGELWMGANAGTLEARRVVPKSRMAQAREGLGSTRAKTSSKAPRSAPKATGRRDKNRRTY
jgi:hypothetical protein